MRLGNLTRGQPSWSQLMRRWQRVAEDWNGAWRVGLHSIKKPLILWSQTLAAGPLDALPTGSDKLSR